MNEPKRFAQGASLELAPLLVWYKHRFFLPNLMVWFGMAVWSAIIVGNGLVISENFKSFPAYFSYALASMIQFVVAMSGIYLPLHWRKATALGKISCIAAWTIVIAFVAFEIFHCIIVEVKNGQGAAMQATHLGQIQNLNRRITAVANSIQKTFKQRRQAYLDLAEDARQGRDTTGVAKCATICRGYMAQYAASSHFIDLDQPFIPAMSSTSVRDVFTDAAGRFSALNAQVARLDEFFNILEKTTAPITIRHDMTSLGEEISRKQTLYANLSEISDRSLAMEEAFSVPGKLVRGQVSNKHTVLAVAYGLAPFLATLLLTLYLRHIVRAREERSNIDDLRRKVSDEEEATKLLKRLRELRETNFRNWIGAVARKWDRMWNN